MTMNNRMTRNLIKELDEKFKEDPSKSGEIRQLSDEELQNPLSHMIVLSKEEEELLLKFPQNERVDMYWKWKSVQNSRCIVSFVTFLEAELEIRKGE